jgi:hypothetical protein
MESISREKWLLLIHQVPPKPNYFRVKIWRRLQQIGAVAIKQSVYALPWSEAAREDLSWILREIVEGGGDASISEASFLEGLNDEQIIRLFRNARKADYEKVIQECGDLREEWDAARSGPQEQLPRIEVLLSRVQRRLAEIEAIDFFSTPQRVTAEMALRELRSRLSGPPGSSPVKVATVAEFTGKTWVTRSNLFVDRLACGWLVRRFIDDRAAFKFVSDMEYTPSADEIRFDMFDAEFTHEGDRCTFEVMIGRMGIEGQALIPVAEIVHDIDLKDEKYGRPETAGIYALLTGLVESRPDDQERMAHGTAIFDQLYEYFLRHPEK